MKLAPAACLLLLITAGCATGQEELDGYNSAELTFAKSASPSGLPGRFQSIDGKRLDGFPVSIRVPAGQHEIAYSCPGVVSLDFQATVKAAFVAGRRYILSCGANEPGVISER
jgi:hypothetical protein